MPSSPPEKPVRAPSKLLKKKSSIAARPSINYNEQPWATAHLHQTSYGEQPTESTALAQYPSDTTTTTTTTTTMPTKTKKTEATTSTSTPKPYTSPNLADESTDIITPLPDRQIYIDPLAGHSNVTIPARPRHKHTYSECFDLADIEPGGNVRSPSGNLLSVEQAAAREDRPSGIRERQAAIRKRVAERLEQGLGNEVTVVGDYKGKEKRESEQREREVEEKGGSEDKDKGKAKKKFWSACRCQ